jgi:hypothetical protein
MIKKKRAPYVGEIIYIKKTKLYGVFTVALVTDYYGL